MGKNKGGTRGAADRDQVWNDVPLDLEWMRYSQEGGILGLEEIDGEEFSKRMTTVPTGKPAKPDASKRTAAAASGKDAGADDGDRARARGADAHGEGELAAPEKLPKAERRRLAKQRRREQLAAREGALGAEPACQAEPEEAVDGARKRKREAADAGPKARPAGATPDAKPAGAAKSRKLAAAAPGDAGGAASAVESAREGGSDGGAGRGAAQPADGGRTSTAPVSVDAWRPLGLHRSLLRALSRVGFSQPTPIQAACVPAAIAQGMDVIGAAETGSGKTLAFALPIAHHLLTARRAAGAHDPSPRRATAEGGGEGEGDDEVAAGRGDDGGGDGGGGDDGGAGEDGEQHGAADAPTALILLPTRELALQVAEHFAAVLPRSPDTRVIALVGGMAIPKQRRLLTKRPAVIVATPGRLWELLTQHSDAHLARLSRVRFLVLDEADRMVAPGHFAELGAIVDMVEGGVAPSAADATGGEGEGEGGDGDGDDGGDGGGGEEEEEGARAEARAAPRAPPRQTFLFSATLTLPAELRRKRGAAAAPKGKGGRKGGKKGRPAPAPPADMAAVAGGGENPAMLRLFDKLRFHRPVHTVDLSREQLTVETLQQRKLACVAADKEAILFTLLCSLRPRRGIVFANSIACIRRLGALLPLLELPTVTLHASMQQRQRLQHLDKFKKLDGAVLLATDVAARGLDIKGLEYVVHYQLPHTVETYVHRSGRTARARSDGLSIALVEPAEEKRYRTIAHGLGMGAEGFQRFEGLGVLSEVLPRVHRAIHLAAKLDQQLHSERKAKAKADWLQRAAEEMDIEMDDDLRREIGVGGGSDSDEDEDEDDAPGRRRGRQPAGPSRHELEAARAELKRLLQRLLRPTAAQRAATPHGAWQAVSTVAGRVATGGSVRTSPLS